MGKKYFIIILLVMVPLCQWAEGKTDIRLKPVFQIGDRDIIFDSITSICEDKDQNIFVLDRKAYLHQG